MREFVWRKSSRSAQNGECVEVMASSGRVSVRDTKDPAGPVLTVAPDAWRGLLAGVARGLFDR